MAVSSLVAVVLDDSYFTVLTLLCLRQESIVIYLPTIHSTFFHSRAVLSYR